ncbi:hypothetical protein NLM59_04600 [Weeksellaceae bacterium KMM 9724]|uniref:hypothetical protein n=1 Tax=Profundicola chukchiensis TaxID=2961959 RepID=UPI002437BA68|nr:hypothetical protein [Profundicola chukchiensis]MDG4950194.1 hypothetical protein [Profundicola chukchiensis]
MKKYILIFILFFNAFICAQSHYVDAEYRLISNGTLVKERVNFSYYDKSELLTIQDLDFNTKKSQYVNLMRTDYDDKGNYHIYYKTEISMRTINHRDYDLSLVGTFVFIYDKKNGTPLGFALKNQSTNHEWVVYYNQAGKVHYGFD